MKMLIGTAFLLLAQLLNPGGQAPQGAQPLQEQVVDIHMTAFYALRDVDAAEEDAPEAADAAAEDTEEAGAGDAASVAAIPEALEPYESLLDALPYEQFTLVTQDHAQTEAGQEVQMPISGIFTFYATPMPTTDGAAIGLSMRVEMLQDDGYRDALRATGQAAPNQPLVMRGLPVNRGELVVVVEVRSEQEEQEGGGGDGEPDSDEPEDQNNEDQDQAPEEDADQDEDAEQDDPEPEEAPSEDPPQNQSESAPEETPSESDLDMQNLEALLEYLEEVDRREQEEIRRQRNDIEIRGDWW